MPLSYDDIPGSWGVYSKDWPETKYTIGKWLLCTKAHVVPYGSYVVVSPNYPSDDGAVIRIETEELKMKLEEAYYGMFVQCKSYLRQEFEA